MRGVVKEFKCVGGPLDGATVKLRDGYDYLSVSEGVHHRCQYGTNDIGGIVDRWAIYVSNDGQTLQAVDKFNDQTAAEYMAKEKLQRAALDSQAA
jgi:hypothetical protein